MSGHHVLIELPGQQGTCYRRSPPRHKSRSSSCSLASSRPSSTPACTHIHASAILRGTARPSQRKSACSSVPGSSRRCHLRSSQRKHIPHTVIRDWGVAVQEKKTQRARDTTRETQSARKTGRPRAVFGFLFAVLGRNRAAARTAADVPSPALLANIACPVPRTARRVAARVCGAIIADTIPVSVGQAAAAALVGIALSLLALRASLPGESVTPVLAAVALVADAV